MAIKVTNRKPLKGRDRSHALNTSNRARKLNLQVVRLQDGTKVRLTAREIRTLNKQNKIAA
jgi:ribosomal protein L28